MLENKKLQKGNRVKFTIWQKNFLVSTFFLDKTNKGLRSQKYKKAV